MIVYVSRTVGGIINGVYANLQPGYAEEAIDNTDTEVIDFLNGPTPTELIDQQRAAAMAEFLNDPSNIARITRAIALVLGEEVNLIRAAFVVNTGGGVWNPASMANNTGVNSPNIAVTGALIGDVVDVRPPYSLAGVMCMGFVSATNTVVIRLQNGTGATVDLASGTWAVAVRRPVYAPPRIVQELTDAVTAKIQAG